jgi:hypothetical protein
MHEKKSSTKTKPEESFFQKRKRLWTFLGALIVFVTFVIKEGVKEELKERLDAINNAETVYAIRQDNTRISASRITIEWREIKNKMSQDKPSARLPVDRIDQDKDLLDETDDALNSSFSNLFALEMAARTFDATRIPDLTDQQKVKEKLKEDYNAMLTGELTDDDYFQPRGAKGRGDCLGRRKLPQAESPGARILFRGSPRACRSPDSIPPKPYSRCVAAGHS